MQHVLARQLLATLLDVFSAHHTRAVEPLQVRLRRVREPASMSGLVFGGKQFAFSFVSIEDTYRWSMLAVARRYLVTDSNDLRKERTDSHVCRTMSNKECVRITNGTTDINPG